MSKRNSDAVAEVANKKARNDREVVDLVSEDEEEEEEEEEEEDTGLWEEVEEEKEKDKDTGSWEYLISIL